MKKLFRKKSKVIIGASGPSLGKIDYLRLPKHAKVWRINDFFREDHYFLGRRVDAVFNGGRTQDIIDRYHTFHVLAEQGAYDIDFDMMFADKLYSELPRLFKGKYDVISSCDREQKIGLWPVIEYNRVFRGRHSFTGVAAVIQAMLSGFDEIYIIGIDNDYESAAEYAFSGEKTHKGKLEWVKSFHPAGFQWDLLRKYQEKTGACVFVLSKETPAFKFFPLAPRARKRPYVPERKEGPPMECLVSPWQPTRSVELEG